MEPNYLEKVDLEFRELAAIPVDNDAGFPEIADARHPRPSFQQNSDDLEKLFAPDEQGLLQKRDVVRSEVKPKPAEEQSCEEFFSVCEKRSSSPHKIRLFKRMVDGELLIEGFDDRGACVYSRTDKAGEEIPSDSPLAKASITSSMFKTLELIRSALTADELEAAAKAIKSLDIDAFLQICRRAQAAA